MKKSFRKSLLLITVIALLVTCFITTAVAATAVKDTVSQTYYFTYSGSNATLTKNTSSAQVWNMPDTVKYNSKTYTVTDISSTFFANSSYSSSVHTLKLPANLKTISQGTFNSKVGYLKTIEIPGTVTTSSDYFLGCNRLEAFIVNENNPNLSAVDGVLFKGTYLQRFPVAKTLSDSTVYEIPDGTTRILTYAFHGAKNITDVKVPASVDTIRAGAFCDSSITGVHFEDGSTFDVSTYGCYCDDSSIEKCADRITFCLEDEAEGVEASCTAAGHTAGLRCDITGEWFTGEEIPAKDHDFSVFSYQKEATCVDNAARVYECAYGCGEIEENELVESALGHTGGTATCSSLAVCTRCSTEYGELASDNHSFTSYVFNNDAACEKDGTKTAVCDYGCNETDTVAAEGTALEHSFTAYTLTSQATCYTDAKETAYCDNGCGQADERVLAGTATGHADADGDYVCDNCDETLRSPADDCTHMCHKTGFMGFIWKIVRFFIKLFKVSPVCDCGALHY